MKKQFYLKGLMMALLLFVGVSASWADTWTWTAASGDFGTTTPNNVTLNNKAWTVTRSAVNYTGWISNCIQLGKKDGVETVTLTSSAFTGTITNVSVECGSYNGAHKCTIKAGGTTYVNAESTASWQSTSTISTGTINASGEISISFSNGSRALYIKSISVTTQSSATYTVTFSAGTNGTCATTSLTESSANAGVTLPNVTNVASGYNFIGWSTTEGGTSANAGAAGATYHPTSNCTLYAVYKQYYTLTITQPSEGGTLTVKNGDTSLSTGDHVNVGTNLTCEVTNIPEGKRFSRFYAEWDNSQSKYKSTNPATFDNIDTENITALAVRVAYQDLAQYTINYMVNGQNTNPQENVWEGTALAFPTPSAISGKVFKGWVEAVIDGTTNDEPTFVSTAGLTATANKTYYAVFASVNQGTSYTKVTDISVLTAGDNLIFTGSKEVSGSTTYYGMKAWDGEANNCKPATITISDNTITSIGEACEVVLGGTTDNWTLFDGAYYLYAAGTKTSGTNYLKGKDTSDDACKWKLSISNNILTITSVNNSKTPYMRYNSSSDLFSCYSSNSSNDAIVLYRKAGAIYSDYSTTVPTSADITIGSYGYATFVTPCALDFDGTGVTAYTVSSTITDNKVTLTSVTKVPAGKAIVVKGSATTHTIPATASADAITTALTYSSTATAYSSTVDRYYLGVEGGVVGFRKLAEGGSIAAGKCFFETTAGAKFLDMSFDDEVSGINTVENSQNNGVAYNLAGQRVNANTKGIVIINGKKYFNK